MTIESNEGRADSEMETYGEGYVTGCFAAWCGDDNEPPTAGGSEAFCRGFSDGYRVESEKAEAFFARNGDDAVARVESEKAEVFLDLGGDELVALSSPEQIFSAFRAALHPWPRSDWLELNRLIARHIIDRFDKL